MFIGFQVFKNKLKMWTAFRTTKGNWKQISNAQ